LYIFLSHCTNNVQIVYIATTMFQLKKFITNSTKLQKYETISIRFQDNFSFEENLLKKFQEI